MFSPQPRSHVIKKTEQNRLKQSETEQNGPKKGGEKTVDFNANGFFEPNTRKPSVAPAKPSPGAGGRSCP
jgi:hypothetical protein